MKSTKRMLAMTIIFSMILAMTSPRAYANDLQSMENKRVISIGRDRIGSFTGLKLSPNGNLGEENNIDVGEDETKSTYLETESTDLEQDETEEPISEETTTEESSSLPMDGELISTYGITYSIKLADLATTTSGTGWKFENSIIKFDMAAAGNTYNIVGDSTEYTYAIDVNVGVGSNITINLNKIKLDTSLLLAPAFKISSGLVTINLIGDNTLKSAENYAGLQITGAKGETELEITTKDKQVGTGSLTATGGVNGAGIGGGSGANGSEITISGGNVTSNGGTRAAGIGGGSQGSGKEITISGGDVTSNGGESDEYILGAVAKGGGAGIGGGYEASGEGITISGGNVTSNGGELGAGIGGGHNGAGSIITIAGGTVEAIGGFTSNGSGAGIGGGNKGAGSVITISDGIIEATAGKRGAAGIGGGTSGAGTGITISGGKIIAEGGGGGAGIGGGDSGSLKGIVISGGEVSATGKMFASGIGGGAFGNLEEMTISGGKITATGGLYGAGIGGGTNGGNVIDITITGGEIAATGGQYGAGIGGGYYGNLIGLTISGGKIEATAGQYGAGIGGGATGAGSDITISGGKVEATGGKYGAGIGGGGSNDTQYASGNCHNISITNDAKVLAIAGDFGVSIGAGNHSKNSSKIGTAGDVTIDTNAYIIAIDSKNCQVITAIKSSIEGTSNACIFTVKDGKQALPHPTLEGVDVSTDDFSVFSTDINPVFTVYNGVRQSFVFSKSRYNTQWYIAENILSKDIIMNGDGSLTHRSIITVVDKDANLLADVNVKYEGRNYKTDANGMLVLNGASTNFKIALSKAGYQSQSLTVNEPFVTIMLLKTVPTTSTNSGGYPAKEITGYSLSYHLNGGTGNFEIESLEKSGKITITDKVPSKTAYKFTVWNTQADGSGTDYKAGDILVLDKNIILYAQWEKIETEELISHPFTDIDNHWAENDIIDIYHKGLVKGVTPTLFAPNTELSRGMLITILWRLEGSPSTSSNNFSDVKLDSYYKKAVDWGYENKIIFGTGDDEFSPNNPITREDLCTILYRYEKFKGGNAEETASLDSFKDSENVSDYAKNALEWAVANGIVVGTNENMLNPKSGATRAEIASILARYLAGK